MKEKRLLFLLGGVVLLAVAVTVGVGLVPILPKNLSSNPNSSPSGTVASVNGELISQPAMDEAYNGLLQSYRQKSAENGNNFDDLMKGPAGSYYQLQMRFQAASSVINQVLLQQEIKKEKIAVSPEEVESALKEKLDKFIQDNGLQSEAFFNAVLQDPGKRVTAQRLLNFKEKSVAEIKDRMRSEIQLSLPYQKLAQAIVGPNVDISSQESQDKIKAWQDNARASATILYFDPLLDAYSKEALIANGGSLEERNKLLDDAIAAYEKVKNEKLSNDPNLDYYLGHLYNLSVNWDLQLQKDLVTKAQQNLDAKKESDALQKSIEYHRSQASLALSAYNTDSEDQLNFLLQADPGNPYYYYLMANFYYKNWQTYTIKKPLSLLSTAISMEPKYVDAHVLLGDVNIVREFYTKSIKNYEDALSSFEAIRSDPTYVHLAQNSNVQKVQRKLAEANLGRADQLDHMSDSGKPVDAAAERAKNLSEAEKWLNLTQTQLTKEKTDELSYIARDLGDLEILKKNYSAARQHYLDSLNILPDIDVQIKLGKAYFLNQQISEAEESYQKAIQMDQGSAHAHEGLAQVYRSQGRLDQAKAEYKTAFDHGANLDYVDRREIALEALDLAPDDEGMLLQLAEYYYERNVFAGANIEYEAVLSQNSKSVAATVGVGKVLLSKLLYDEASKKFKEALQLSPTKQEEMGIYEWLVKTEKGIAGPGKPISDFGQEALYRLAVLYLNDGRLSKSYATLQELSSKYPGFRMDEIAQFRQKLTQTVGDSLPGLPLADQGHEIITPGATHPAYNSAPPTSGWHYALPAHWGILNNTIEDEIQLRNLASGGILIQYPPSLDQPTLDSLVELVTTLRKDQNYCSIILAPNPKAANPIVLTAWNRIDQFADFNRGRIVSFVDAFLGRGPEAGEVGCTLGSSK
jgi:tetratricopeptide (TPR) repeat protein